MPIRRVNEFDNAWERLFGERRSNQHVNPAGIAFTVENVAQLPLAGAFLDNQAGEAEIPFQEKSAAKLWQHRAGAGHFAQRTGFGPALHLAGPALVNFSFESGAVHGNRFFISSRRRRLESANGAMAGECKNRARAPARQPPAAPAGN